MKYKKKIKKVLRQNDVVKNTKNPYGEIVCPTVPRLERFTFAEAYVQQEGKKQHAEEQFEELSV